MRTSSNRSCRWLALTVAGCCCLFTARAGAADWPQWQGPNRDGISADTGLLKQWPKEGPPLAWRIDGLGGGDSAPAVAAGRIYGMAIAARTKSFGPCPRRTARKFGSPASARHSPSRSQSKEGPGCTPTVDGERLYVEGMGGDVACLQVKDGKVLWQRSLTRILAGACPCGVTVNRRSWMVIRSLSPPARRTRCWWPSTS